MIDELVSRMNTIEEAIADFRKGKNAGCCR